MKRIVYIAMAAALLLALGACRGDGGGNSGGNHGEAPLPPPTAPDDAPGHDNQVPPSPAPGQSRAGETYSIYVISPATGDTVAFTVFEPALLEGGETYPLLLYGHGGGESRATDKNNPALVYSPFNDNIKRFIDAGYGVISMDQRGHGESTGDIRLMDPDYEGQNLLALLDWAEVKLDWLAYAPGPGGRNAVMGGIGASYGGGFQLLLHDIDPRQRLDALVPESTWNDLGYSIYPNGVAKSSWLTFLSTSLLRAGSGLDRNHADPYVMGIFESLLTKNQLSEQQQDFLYYHSNAYFCGGREVATNGGPDTAPLYAPRPPRPVNAMFFQGMRDTLFTFTEAYRNYRCYREAGGDVRLLSYQTGHNATPIIVDPALRPTFPDPENPGMPSNAGDNRCGSLSVQLAALAFFDEHLKGIAGAADSVPTQACLSLDNGDAVLVEEVTAGRAGTEVAIPATTVVAGILDLPVAVELAAVTGDDGEVIAGIPHLALTVQSAASDAPVEPIIFAGIGLMRATQPGIWELIDNQVTPIRGTGAFELAMNGLGERLAAGDRLALLLYGGHDQYPYSGAINLAQPSPMVVTVEGSVWLPLLGPQPAAP